MVNQSRALVDTLNAHGTKLLLAGICLLSSHQALALSDFPTNETTTFMQDFLPTIAEAELVDLKLFPQLLQHEAKVKQDADTHCASTGITTELDLKHEPILGSDDESLMIRSKYVLVKKVGFRCETWSGNKSAIPSLIEVKDLVEKSGKTILAIGKYSARTEWQGSQGRSVGWVDQRGFDRFYSDFVGLDLSSAAKLAGVKVPTSSDYAVGTKQVSQSPVSENENLTTTQVIEMVATILKNRAGTIPSSVRIQALRDVKSRIQYKSRDTSAIVRLIGYMIMFKESGPMEEAAKTELINEIMSYVEKTNPDAAALARLRMATMSPKEFQELFEAYAQEKVGKMESRLSKAEARNLSDLLTAMLISILKQTNRH